MSANAFQGWTGTISALLIKEIEKRFGKAGGTLMALMEPISLILTISAMHIFLGGKPEYGTSVVLFYSTGILPHYAFVWISTRTKGADTGIARFPKIQVLDQVIAQALLEMTIILLAMIGVYTALWLWGIGEAWPSDPGAALSAVAFLGLFGFAVGLINAIVMSFIPLWRPIYHVLIRGALLVSGVFFVPDFMLPRVREWLSWNPMLHGVVWFRSAFYPAYPHHILDKGYIVSLTIIGLAMSLALERATRRKRAFR